MPALQTPWAQHERLLHQVVRSDEQPHHPEMRTTLAPTQFLVLAVGLPLLVVLLVVIWSLKLVAPLPR